MNIKTFIKKHYFIIIVLLLFLIKIFLVDNQIIYIKGYEHDDLYFAKSVVHLLNGNWLGSYNDITLTKGISGILFIYLARLLNIDYLSFQNICYSIACLSMIHMLSNLIKKKSILLIIYILLLFNPISYSEVFSYVYRDGFYTILTMLLISISFELLFAYNKSTLKYIIYTIIYSIVITAILLCREETLCVTPYIIVSIVILMISIIINKKCNYKLLKLLVILITPLFIYYGSNHIIAKQNLKCYKRYVVNDFTSKDFKDLYGALTRIKQKNYIKRVPLNRESRNELYKLSPTFKELEYYLEGEEFKKYYNSKDSNDLQEGFLYWAVRRSAYNLGYYDNAEEAYKFNTKLANEINNLCDTKKIDCYKKRSSLTAPFQAVLIKDFITILPVTINKQITFEHTIINIPEKENISKIFIEATNNKMKYENKNKIPLLIMNILLVLYRMINIPLFLLSIILGIKLIPTLIKRRKELIYTNLLLLGLFGIYILRILAVNFVATAEYYEAINKTQYLAPAFPIQALLSFLIIYYYNELIRKNKKDIN